MHGYHASYRLIDLADGSCREVPIEPAVLQNYIGGVGLGVWLLLKESRGNYDALAPEAPLVFAFAPLVGSALNTSAKAAVLSKSPLTHRLNDAMLSSGFALAGKASGADAIVVKGACREWSTLFVEPSGTTIRATPELEGLSAAETETRIHEDWGEEWNVISIGPAGDKGIPFALMSHDGRHAGRGGTGTVMGAKKLKAVAVKGGRPTSVADSSALAEIQARLQKNSLGAATEKYRTTGTLGNLLVFNRLNILPTLNFRGKSTEEAQGLSAEHLFREKKVHRATCADCMIGCEKRVTGRDGKPVRMEYENIFALGSLLGIWDADLVLEASQLCDRLGLDTITMGGTLAFAMECVERGLLDLPDLRFGNGAILLDAIRKTAAREDYGELLALGSRALAQRVGGGSEAFAAQVKGLEMPGYHPGRLQTLGLGFAVGSRGADHNKSGAYDLDLSGRVDRYQLDEERIAEMVEIENQAAIIDSLILCKFVRRALTDFYGDSVEMLRAITGFDFDQEGLRKAAEKIHHLKKIFNQRQGWRMEEDTLPARFFAGGEAADAEGIDPAEFAAARKSYYDYRGWDARGELRSDARLLQRLDLA